MKFHGQNKGSATASQSNDLGKPNQATQPKPPITSKDILEEVGDLLDRHETKNGLFKAMPANRWIEQAKTRPIPKMLFGEFWFEGELCILFADTNLGKSILAVQIGDSISRGVHVPGFKFDAKRQKILYFDFELSDKQFENRYSADFEKHYDWDEYFIRVEVDPDSEIPENQSFENFLNASLEQTIVNTGAKVLIIDNLTYLKQETEKAKDALPLMKHLKALKSKYGLSILALAHTPKRDLSKPITRNDLQGSKMLINFCDSSFTIGESHQDKQLRYFKQIKQRNTEQLYDGGNVCLCQIIKEYNFLQFEFMGFSTEEEHLKKLTQQDRDSNILMVKEMIEQGKSQRAIAKELGIAVGTVNKYSKK